MAGAGGLKNVNPLANEEMTLKGQARLHGLVKARPLKGLKDKRYLRFGRH